MSVPKKRRSSSRSRRAKTAKAALSKSNFVTCENCQEPKRPHVACANCGQHKGRQIIAVERRQKRLERKQKRNK